MKRKTATDNKEYVLNPEEENSLDVVVQHMYAGGFTVEEIIKKVKVTKEYVVQCTTPLE